MKFGNRNFLIILLGSLVVNSSAFGFELCNHGLYSLERSLSEQIQSLPARVLEGTYRDSGQQGREPSEVPALIERARAAIAETTTMVRGSVDHCLAKIDRRIQGQRLSCDWQSYARSCNQQEQALLNQKSEQSAILPGLLRQMAVQERIIARIIAVNLGYNALRQVALELDRTGRINLMEAGPNGPDLSQNLTQVTRYHGYPANIYGDLSGQRLGNESLVASFRFRIPRNFFSTAQTRSVEISIKSNIATFDELLSLANAEPGVGWRAIGYVNYNGLTEGSLHAALLSGTLLNYSSSQESLGNPILSTGIGRSCSGCNYTAADISYGLIFIDRIRAQNTL